MEPNEGKSMRRKGFLTGGGGGFEGGVLLIEWMRARICHICKHV